MIYRLFIGGKMDKNQVINAFIRILNWAGNREAKSYGIPEKLYTVEIHIIAVIGRNPGILQRDICKEIGVTKGRISIIIRKLEKKGLVIKSKNESDKREMPLELTEKGQIAYHNHEEKEKIILDEVNKLLESCSKEELNKAGNIFEQLLKIMQ